MIIDELKSTFLYMKKADIQTKELEWKTKEWYKVKNEVTEKDNVEYIEHMSYHAFILDEKLPTFDAVINKTNIIGIYIDNECITFIHEHTVCPYMEDISPLLGQSIPRKKK